MATFYCINSECNADQWEVIILGKEHWQVSDSRGTWSIAADVPICPTCGDNLNRHPSVGTLNPAWFELVGGVA